jgi:hypothetical protein
VKIASGILAGILLLSIPGATRAQLVFEKKEVDLKAGLSDKEVVARFPFRNAGNYTVHIGDIETSCGCTTAVLEKRTYAPNEKGEITATFEIGDRIGLQDKTILVETDDPKASTISLDMRITIPDLLEVRPALLYWRHGEAPTAKTLTVKVLNGLPVKEVTASSSDPKVKTKVETVTPGKEYTVAVTPPGDGTTVDSLISISADYPPGTARYFYARARIR